MTELEAIRARHSVRSYLSKPLSGDIVKELEKQIDHCNRHGNLHFQLVTGEESAFRGFLAHYGKFENVQNYVALVGSKSEDLDEKTGYYGEQLVLRAQQLGLNTCWVALTFKKGAAKSHCLISPDEKLVCLLALGYGKTQGSPRKQKTIGQICRDEPKELQNLPDWYRQGMEAALLAPTAVNQQKFVFSRRGNIVYAQSTGGFYAKVDLGIVKYHFEVGAGKDQFIWGK